MAEPKYGRWKAEQVRAFGVFGIHHSLSLWLSTTDGFLAACICRYSLYPTLLERNQIYPFISFKCRDYARLIFLSMPMPRRRRSLAGNAEVHRAACRLLARLNVTETSTFGGFPQSQRTGTCLCAGFTWRGAQRVLSRRDERSGSLVMCMWALGRARFGRRT